MIEINKILNEQYEEVTPREFYETMFSTLALESYGEYCGKSTGKYVALAQNIKIEKPFQLFRDLEDLETISKLDNLTIIAPVSYFGRRRKKQKSVNTYGICIDLDGIEEEIQVHNLIKQINTNILPTPTFLISSGSGLHVYYIFNNVVKLNKNNSIALGNLKEGLTRLIINKDISSEHERPHLQSIHQGYRMVGSLTKHNTITKAYAVGNLVDIEYLNNFLQEEYKYNPKKLSFEEAKEKYPNWDPTNLSDKPKRTRNYYSNYLKRLKKEARVGRRHNQLYCLSVQAVKSDIPYTQLEKDALSLFTLLNSIEGSETKPFTKNEILNAISQYNPEMATVPLQTIEGLTGMHFEPQKRNGRIQSEHLKIARKNIKNAGRKSVEKEVQEYIKKHPKTKIVDIAKALNIHTNTVSKYKNKK